MNKRIKKKVAKERYHYALNHIANISELSKEMVKREIHYELWQVAQDIHDAKAFLEWEMDLFSTNLMRKYKTGWLKNEHYVIQTDLGYLGKNGMELVSELHDANQFDYEEMNECWYDLSEELRKIYKNIGLIQGMMVA